MSGQKRRKKQIRKIEKRVISELFGKGRKRRAKKSGDVITDITPGGSILRGIGQKKRKGETVLSSVKRATKASRKRKTTFVRKLGSLFA